MNTALIGVIICTVFIITVPLGHLGKQPDIFSRASTNMSLNSTSFPSSCLIWGKLLTLSEFQLPTSSAPALVDLVSILSWIAGAAELTLEFGMQLGTHQM